MEGGCRIASEYPEISGILEIQSKALVTTGLIDGYVSGDEKMGKPGIGTSSFDEPVE